MIALRPLKRDDNIYSNSKSPMGLSGPARPIFPTVRTLELPQFSRSSPFQELYLLQFCSCRASSMEEARILDGNLGKLGEIVDGVDEEDTENIALFIELKHHCVQLLDLLQNPEKDHSFLSHLLHLLRKSSPLSLQPLFEYVFAFKFVS